MPAEGGGRERLAGKAVVGGKLKKERMTKRSMDMEGVVTGRMDLIQSNIQYE